jgi:hypothetical protein
MAGCYGGAAVRGPSTVVPPAGPHAALTFRSMTAETQSAGGGSADGATKKSNLVPILIVVGIIVVVAIAGGVYLLTRDSGGSSAPEGEAPPKVAKDLYAAWQDGDQAAAAKVADSGTVTAIFAIDKNEGSDLKFGGCEKTGGTPLPKDCSFTRAGGQLVITVSNVDGKRTATAVKLGPAATTPTSTP